MPKKNYNPTHTPVTSESRPERIPLFKRPYDGGRVTALEGDVREIFDRLDGVEDRFDGLDDRLEEILRACQGTSTAAPEGAAAATPPLPPRAKKTVGSATPPPPPPAPSGVKQQVAAEVESAVRVQPEPKPQPKPESQPRGGVTINGVVARPGYAYVWWDAQNRVWVPCTDIWAAKQGGNGVYHPKWAWLDAQGRIVRFLTADEIVRYCP